MKNLRLLLLTCLLIGSLGLTACNSTDLGFGYNPGTGQIDLRIGIKGDGKTVIVQPVITKP